VAGRRSLALPVACMGFFMVVLDSTVVNIALPSVARDLGGGISGLQWVVDGYTVTFGALMLSAGHVSDRIGASVSFGRGLAAFGISSAACGLAPTLGVLLVARVGQGAAGALMLPASLALVGQAHADPRERGRAIAIWAAVGGTAVAAGPVVGGVLTQTVGWRAVFFVNVPIAILALGLLLRVTRSPRRATRFDLPGQLLAVAALFCLTFGVIEGAHVGFGKPQIVISLVGFLLTSASFVYVEGRADEPAVPLKLLATHGAAGTMGAGLAIYFSFYGIIFVLSLFFQRILHAGPAVSGLMFVPMTALITLATMRTASWTHRRGAWVPVTVGLLIMLAGALALVAINAQTPWWEIAVGTVPVGVGAGIAGPAIPVALLAAIPTEQSGIASGVANALRNVAATLGVAIFGALLAGNGGFSSGVQRVFLVSAGTLALAVVLAVAWIRPRPQHPLPVALASAPAGES
jgi:DHA2 family methylenomycin A resistance protein-like MFS transporter